MCLSTKYETKCLLGSSASVQLLGFFVPFEPILGSWASLCPVQADPPPEDIPLESQPDPLPTEAPPQEDIPPAEEHPVEIPPAEEAPTDTPPAEEPQVEIRTDEL